MYTAIRVVRDASVLTLTLGSTMPHYGVPTARMLQVRCGPSH